MVPQILNCTIRKRFGVFVNYPLLETFAKTRSTLTGRQLVLHVSQSGCILQYFIFVDAEYTVLQTYCSSLGDERALSVLSNLVLLQVRVANGVRNHINMILERESRLSGVLTNMVASKITIDSNGLSFLVPPHLVVKLIVLLEQVMKAT